MLKLAKALKYAVTIIILCSLQVSVTRYISVFGVSPNIVLAFVISVSVVCGPVEGGVIGLICGIIIDALCSGMTVLNSIAYMYSGAFCGYFATSYLRKNISAAFIFTFVASILCEEAAHFLHFAIWNSSGLFSGFLYPILPAAAYSAIISIPVYYLTDRLFRQNHREGLHING